MNKKFLTVLTTSLALCFTLGAFGCGSGDGGGKSDLGGNPSTPPPFEDPTEAAYTAVKTAYDNAKSYNGAWTINSTYTNEGRTRDGLTSFDAASKRYIDVDSRQESDGTLYRNDEVMWKQGDYYFNYKQGLQNGERYSWESKQIPEWEFGYSFEKAIDYITEEYCIIPNASSFAALKTAWEEVASAELAEVKQESPDAEGTVTLAVQTVNNVSTLTMNMRAVVNVSGETHTRECSSILKAAGGKLIGISIARKESTSEGEISLEYNWDISYTFDEEAFNGVAKPEEVTGRDDLIFSDEITLSYKGTEWQHSVTDCFDTDDVLTQITNSSQIFYGSLLGYFADEACTIPVDGYTITEFMALEKIYVDFKVPTSGVLIIHLLGSEYNYSEHAKIVDNQFNAFDYDSAYACTIYASHTYALSSNYDKHYVNGVETEAGDLSFEGGQVYIIQSVYECTDEDVSAFFGAL